MLSIILAKKITSLLLILLLGFLSVRLNIVKSVDSYAINKLKVYIFTPLMILNSFQVDWSPDILKSFLIAIAVTLAIQLIYIGITVLIRKPLGLSLVEQAAIEYTNSGGMIVPLVIGMFGNDWLIYSLAYNSTGLILVWTHLNAMMSGKRKLKAKDIFLNINLITIFVGFILFRLKIILPDIVKDVLQTGTNIVGPLGMLTAGMLLGDQDLKKFFTNKRAYFISFFRLIVYPLITLFLFKIVGVDKWPPAGENVMIIAFLACSSATATNVVSISQLYNQQPEYASVINVITTVLCVITMPIMVYLYQLF